LGVVAAQTQYNLKNAKEYFEEQLCVGDYYNHRAVCWPVGKIVATGQLVPRRLILKRAKSRFCSIVGPKICGSTAPKFQVFATNPFFAD
jgi:hypothetical protein